MSGPGPKPRAPMLERDQAPPELVPLYDALLQVRGVVPNMFKMLANTPALAQGFAAFLKPLLGDGALPGWYKELVAAYMSTLLGSSYAVAGHTLSARQKGASEEQVAAIQSDFERGPFTEAEKLGFRCAERLNRSAREVDDVFFGKLQEVFDSRQIIELMATAAAFAFFPRFVDVLRIPITPLPQSAGGVS